MADSFEGDIIAVRKILDDAHVPSKGRMLKFMKDGQEYTLRLDNNMPFKSIAQAVASSGWSHVRAGQLVSLGQNSVCC